MTNSYEELKRPYKTLVNIREPYPVEEDVTYN